MPRTPSRSSNLAPGSQRARKSRGVETTKAPAGNVTIPEPNEEWCHAARMIWDSMIESGGANFYESSDYAVLYLVADQVDHLYQQGGRRSPEYLRVIMQSLGTLLATEGDRRKLHIELERDDDQSEIESNVVRLFEQAGEAK